MIKHFSLRFTLFLIIMDLLLVVLALIVATVMRILIPFGIPAVPAAAYPAAASRVYHRARAV